jgi:hypothetical protein
VGVGQDGDAHADIITGAGQPPRRGVETWVAADRPECEPQTAAR